MTDVEVSRTCASQQKMLGGESGILGLIPVGPAVPVCGQEPPSLTTLAPVPFPLNLSPGISRQNSEFGQCFPSVFHTQGPRLSSGKW